MAWHLFRAKPLHEPVTYFQLNPQEQVSMTLESRCEDFHPIKCSWKCCFQNHFTWVSIFQGLNYHVLCCLIIERSSDSFPVNSWYHNHLISFIITAVEIVAHLQNQQDACRSVTMGPFWAGMSPLLPDLVHCSILILDFIISGIMIRYHTRQPGTKLSKLFTTFLSSVHLYWCNIILQ